MNRWPAWVGRTLLACTAAEIAERPLADLRGLLDGRDASPIAEAARQHHVEACVYQGLRVLAPTSPVLPRLQAGYVRHQRHQFRLKADLVALAAILDELGVPWCVVKGPYLSEIAYERHDLRDYVDLDLIVGRGSFSRVVRALQARWYSVVRRDWSLATRQLAGEIDLVSPSGTPVDLHWETLYHENLRSQFALQTEQMLERARSVTIARTSIRVPDPADALIHLAVHAFREGGVRLQWIKDVDQVVRHDPPSDWTVLVERARERSLSLVVGTLLWRSRRLLGAPVPPETVDTLLPRSWRATLGVADRLSPPQRSTAHRSAASLLTRSARADLRTTTRELLASSQALLRTSLGRTSATSGTRPYDTVTGDDDPRNSPVELDRYLCAVAAGAQSPP